MPADFPEIPTDPTDVIDLRYATPEALMDALIFATNQLRHYKAKKEKFSNALIALLELGKIEPSNEFDGYTISFCAGSRMYDYPESIAKLEAELQEAKAVAVAHGIAKERFGKPFWSVRELKT